MGVRFVRERLHGLLHYDRGSLQTGTTNTMLVRESILPRERKKERHLGPRTETSEKHKQARALRNQKDDSDEDDEESAFTSAAAAKQQGDDHEDVYRFIPLQRRFFMQALADMDEGRSKEKAWVR